MAQASIEERDPGAPIARDAIDPDLIKLKRSRPKIGVVTSAGVVFLCAYALFRLVPDLTFSREDAPVPAQAAAVLAGDVSTETFIELAAEPMRSHTIRALKGENGLGLRVSPVRGSGERLWVVLPGDGWAAPLSRGCTGAPAGRCYTGRLRELADLPFASAMHAYAASHPRPVFARGAEVRAGFATNTIKTVTGEDVKVAEADRVAFDVVDPNASTIIATFTPGTEEHAPLLDAAAWQAELARLGIPAVAATAPERTGAAPGQARFDVTMSVSSVTTKLEGAKLWAARVEPVTRHHRTTWGELRGSSPAGFTFEQTTIPDAQIDLVGVYVTREIPDGAYALITSEHPADYWHVLPIFILVGLIGLLFGWALVRGIRRDLLPART